MSSVWFLVDWLELVEDGHEMLEQLLAAIGAVSGEEPSPDAGSGFGSPMTAGLEPKPDLDPGLDPEFDPELAPELDSPPPFKPPPPFPPPPPPPPPPAAPTRVKYTQSDSIANQRVWTMLEGLG